MKNVNQARGMTLAMIGLLLIFETRQIALGVQDGDFLDRVLIQDYEDIPNRATRWQSRGMHRLAKLSKFNRKWGELYQEKLQGALLTHKMRQVTQHNIDLSGCKNQHLELQFYASTIEHQIESSSEVVSVFWNHQVTRFLLTPTPKMYKMKIQQKELINSLRIMLGEKQEPKEVHLNMMSKEQFAQYSQKLKQLQNSKSVLLTDFKIQSSQGHIIFERAAARPHPPFSRTLGIQDYNFDVNEIPADRQFRYLERRQQKEWYAAADKVLLVRLGRYNPNWLTSLPNVRQGVLFSQHQFKICQAHIKLPPKIGLYLSLHLSVVTHEEGVRLNRGQPSNLRVIWNEHQIGQCRAFQTVELCRLYIMSKQHSTSNSLTFLWAPEGKDLQNKHEILLTNVAIYTDDQVRVYHKVLHLKQKVKKILWPSADDIQGDSDKPTSRGRSRPVGGVLGELSKVNQSSTFGYKTSFEERLGIQDSLCDYNHVEYNSLELSPSGQKYWRNTDKTLLVRVLSFNLHWKMYPNIVQAIGLGSKNKNIFQESIMLHPGSYLLTFKNSLKTQNKQDPSSKAYLDVHWNDMNLPAFRCESVVYVKSCKGEIVVTELRNNRLQVRLDHSNIEEQLFIAMITAFEIQDPKTKKAMTQQDMQQMQTSTILKYLGYTDQPYQGQEDRLVEASQFFMGAIQNPAFSQPDLDDLKIGLKLSELRLNKTQQKSYKFIWHHPKIAILARLIVFNPTWQMVIGISQGVRLTSTYTSIEQHRINLQKNKVYELYFWASIVKMPEQTKSKNPVAKQAQSAELAIVWNKRIIGRCTAEAMVKKCRAEIRSHNALGQYSGNSLLVMMERPRFFNAVEALISGFGIKCDGMEYNPSRAEKVAPIRKKGQQKQQLGQSSGAVAGQAQGPSRQASPAPSAAGDSQRYEPIQPRFPQPLASSVIPDVKIGPAVKPKPDKQTVARKLNLPPEQ